MIETVNLIGSLPKNPKKRWARRSIDDIKGIILHQAICSKCSTRGIAKYHTKASPRNHISKSGAPGICYHWTIGYDGTIYRCNEFEDIVWHAGVREYNKHALGICVLGDFNGPTYKGKDIRPTNKQLESVKFLIGDLYRSFNLEYVKGHNEIKKNKVNCPGNDLMLLLNEYRLIL
jgi:N-acetyl-anhydromuramyl-L-alanine amidase AmpD